MEDENHLYGVYAAGELYPARWDKNGFFVTQEVGKEFKCALDLLLPTAVKVDPPKPESA